MTTREVVGLVCIGAALILIPTAWAFSRVLWLVAFVLFGVGGALFYTERMIKREVRLEKESSGQGYQGAIMPSDIHNYTGWRSGGRSEGMDHSADDGGGD